MPWIADLFTEGTAAEITWNNEQQNDTWFSVDVEGPT
jgi:hypothetical protein